MTHLLPGKASVPIRAAIASLLLIDGCAGTAGEAPINRLTAAERTGGWRLLFDGESFDGWHNYGSAPGTPVERWEIVNGTLKMTRDVSPLRFLLRTLNPFGDSPNLHLMSDEIFGSFELSLEWKISPGGNSGIFYLVPDGSDLPPWKTGLEMQVLDNAGHRDGRIDKRRAGDLYDLKGGNGEAVKPAGEWNTARVRVSGDRVRHWLNGIRVIDVRRSGPDWESMLSESKFRGIGGFGQARRGHILLQDHGDVVWYRNIKLRTLP